MTWNSTYGRRAPSNRCVQKSVCRRIGNLQPVNHVNSTAIAYPLNHLYPSSLPPCHPDPYFSIATPSSGGLLVLSSPALSPRHSSLQGGRKHIRLPTCRFPARPPPIFHHICDMHYLNINVFPVIATAFSPQFASHESQGDPLTQHGRRGVPIHLMQRCCHRYSCGKRMRSSVRYYRMLLGIRGRLEVGASSDMVSLGRMGSDWNSEICSLQKQRIFRNAAALGRT